MFYSIIHLALTYLLRCTRKELADQLEWLEPKHVRWCLRHYMDWRLGPEDDDARSILVLTRKLDAVMRKKPMSTHPGDVRP